MVARANEPAATEEKQQQGHTITQKSVSEAETPYDARQGIVCGPRFNPSLYWSHVLLFR